MPPKTTSKKEEETYGGVSKELKSKIKERKEEVLLESAKEEKSFLQGRWVTDEDGLYNKTARKRELWSRQAPKQLAKLSLFTRSGMDKYNDSDASRLELEEREVSDRVTQADILAGADVQTQQKKIHLNLDRRLGPYTIDFTRNGTHLLIGGRRGFWSNMKWKDHTLVGETQLKDKINDLTFLADHTMSAVAQKKYVYMYTKEGTEMHILGNKFLYMDRLAYLPRHMLLAAASSQYSVMRYIDISTGVDLGSKEPSIVQNPIHRLRTNQQNGVVASGDLKGVVKFWSPSVVDPLLEIKTHSSVIEDMCFHPDGRYLLTLGGDHKLKVWDTRTLRALEEYAVNYHFTTIDISHRGLVAMGGETNIQVWKDLFSKHKPSSPFLKFHLGYGNLSETVKFCPFEDILGVGHSGGFSSFIIPGAGEANPDYYDANPHETERHRQERVIHNLLDKLPPDTISMDIQVPGVNEERLAAYNESIRLNRKAKMIRERKERRAAASQEVRVAPTGLLVGEEEEVDELLGYKEAPQTRVLKSKIERAKENKKKKWDKKVTTDKVKSRQTMRNSRAVQRERAQRQYDTIHGSYDRDNLSREESALLAEAAKEKKLRRQREKEKVKDLTNDVRFSAVSSKDIIKRVRTNNDNEEESDFSISKKRPKSDLSTNAALKRFL